MTILHVPHSYKVAGALKGKRKIESWAFAGSIAVQIATPSPDEAPVALRLHRPPSGGSYGKPLRPNAPLDYRFFDGRLYAPYLVGLEEGSETPLAVSDMLEAVRIGSGGQGSPLFDGVQSLFMRSPLAEDDERRRTMKIDRSWEGEVAAEIAARARDLILVDGLVFQHRPGLEPVYEIYPEGAWIEGVFRHTGTIKTRSVADFADKPETIDVRRHFRVDQIAEALMACSKWNEFLTDWDPEDPATFGQVVECRVEILDPSVLAFRPDQGPKLLSCAGKIVAQHGEALAEKPVGFMIAYAGIRDALHAKVPAHEIAPLMREFAEQFARVADPDHHDVRAILGEVETFEMAPAVEPAAAPAARPI
jgi:hypothetical protein